MYMYVYTCIMCMRIYGVLLHPMYMYIYICIMCIWIYGVLLHSMYMYVFFFFFFFSTLHCLSAGALPRVVA